MNLVRPMASSSVAALPHLSRMTECSSQMRDHLKNNDIKKAISSARHMLMNLREELPSSLYMAMYRKAIAELSFLCTALQRVNEKRQKESSMESLCDHSLHSSSYYAEVYELVEGIGHVIPRVYLLITVGSLLMQETPLPKGVPIQNDSNTSADVQKAAASVVPSQCSPPFADGRDANTCHRGEMERSCKKRDLCLWSLAVFRELLFACRGVAHPIRGFFVRHFLLSVTHFTLPGEVRNEGSSVSPKPEALLKEPLSAEANSESMISTVTEKGFMIAGGMGNTSSTAVFPPDLVFQSALLLVENLEEVFNLSKSLLKSSVQLGEGSPSSATSGVLERRAEEEKICTSIALKRLARVIKMVSIDDYCSKLFPRLLSAVEHHPEPFFQSNVLLFFISQFPAVFHFHTITSWIRFLLCSLPPSIYKCSLWKRLLIAIEPFFSTSDHYGVSERKEDGASQSPDAIPFCSSCKALETPSPVIPQTTVLEGISRDEESIGNKTMERVPPVPLTTLSSDEVRSCCVESQQQGRRDTVIASGEVHSLFVLIVDTIGTILSNAAARTPATSSQEKLVDSSERRPRQSETLKARKNENDGSEETTTSVVALKAVEDPHEKKIEYKNPGSDEGRIHELKTLPSLTQKVLSLDTLFEFLNVLVQLSSRISGAHGPAGDRRLALLFELLHRHPLLKEKNTETTGLGNCAESFFWHVALTVRELESFCRLRGIIPLLDELPHIFRRRLALLLCSKVSSEGENEVKNVEIPSSSPCSVANDLKHHSLQHRNDAPSHSDIKALASSSSNGVNQRNVNSGLYASKMNDGKGGNDGDKSNNNGRRNFNTMSERKYSFHSVEGIRIFLGFAVDAFVLSACVLNDNEKRMREIAQENVLEEKRALCQIINSIYHEDRSVFLAMVVAAQQVIEPLSYAFDPFILNMLSIKLLDVASPSHDLFTLPKHRQGDDVQVSTALATIIGAVISTKNATDTPPSLTPLTQKKTSNSHQIGDEAAEITSGRELRPPVIEECRSTSTSTATLSPSSASSKEERETDSVCCLPFTSFCPPMDIVRRVLDDLYSSGEGKGFLERLSLLDAPLGCARYIDAALLANYYHMGEMVDTFLTEASHLQDNFAGENAATEFLMVLVGILSTPLSSLSKEHYERIVLSVTRQCSLLQRKDQQSRMLALCAALHCLPPVVSDEMISKGKLCFDRAQKIGFVVPPVTRLPLMLDLLEMSTQLFQCSIPVVTRKTLTDQVREIRRQIKEQSVTGADNTPNHVDPADSRKLRERYQESVPMKWVEIVERRFNAIVQNMKEYSMKDPIYEEILTELMV